MLTMPVWSCGVLSIQYTSFCMLNQRPAWRRQGLGTNSMLSFTLKTPVIKTACLYKTEYLYKIRKNSNPELKFCSFIGYEECYLESLFFCISVYFVYCFTNLIFIFCMYYHNFYFLKIIRYSFLRIKSLNILTSVF